MGLTTDFFLIFLLWGYSPICIILSATFCPYLFPKCVDVLVGKIQARFSLLNNKSLMFQMKFQYGLRMCLGRAGRGQNTGTERQSVSDCVCSDVLALVWNCLFEFYIFTLVGKHGRLEEVRTLASDSHAV